MECLIDGHHGKFLPQTFYEETDFKKFGLKKSEFKELNNPDGEYYWETWERLIDNAEMTKGGKSYSLHCGESGDLFLATEAEIEEHLN